MIPPKFDYYAPESLEEATVLASQHQDTGKLIAGGHSLIPILKLRLSEPTTLIDLGRIPSLDRISESNGMVHVGARVTHRNVSKSDLISGRIPLLADAAAVIGDPQVRNVGTVGGNLAHADPGSDLPAAVIALGATVDLRSSQKERNVPIDEFFLDLMTTAIQPDEILTAINIPIHGPEAGWSYMKLPNAASHYAIVGIAVLLTVQDGICTAVSVGVTGLGSTPGRATKVEAALVGRKMSQESIATAATEAASGFDILEDIHASMTYRQHVAKIYTHRALTEAWSRAS